MNVYITLLGRSTWALLNSFYASVDEGYEPDLVHVFVEEGFLEELEKVVGGLEIIGEGFGVSPEIETHVISDVDFVRASREIRDILLDLLEGDNLVSIDITPGRKALVTAALLSMNDLSRKEGLNVDNVFYLAIDSVEGAAKPYYMIPFEIQDLRDMMEDVENAKTMES